MKRKILMPFFMLGQFDEQTSLELMNKAVEAGADYLEVGIPHTDPLADGDLLRNTAQEAIKKGMTPKKAIEMLGKIKDQHRDIPVYVLVYLNTLFGYGVEDFVQDVSEAGGSGLVVPDLPLEAQESLRKEFNIENLDLIAFTSPTSTNRTKDIARSATGFIYSVNYTGITGRQKSGQGVDDRAIDNYLAIKKLTSHPVLSGFGIDSPASARLASQHADGVIIGSKICQILEQASPSKRAEELYAFICDIREVL